MKLSGGFHIPSSQYDGSRLQLGYYPRSQNPDILRVQEPMISSILLKLFSSFNKCPWGRMLICSTHAEFAHLQLYSIGRISWGICETNPKLTKQQPHATMKLPCVYKASDIRGIYLIHWLKDVGIRALKIIFTASDRKWWDLRVAEDDLSAQNLQFDHGETCMYLP